jgi:hypothetical protein
VVLGWAGPRIGMRAPLILYSTNTWLAFHIAERYYRGEHYVWCTPFFNDRSDKGDSGFVAPTSCPSEIYRSLYREWRAGDRHSIKIEHNRNGILRGVKTKREAGAISEDQKKDIVAIVERAEVRDFEPLVYVMPFARVSRLVREVPVKDRAHPLSQEYVVQGLPRRLFDVITLELQRVCYGVRSNAG